MRPARWTRASTTRRGSGPASFATLATETNPADPAISLSAGLGLVTFESPRGRVWFKGGHNEWTGNMLVCLERQQRCLVMLSNDVRAERIYPDLTRTILTHRRPIT